MGSCKMEVPSESEDTVSATQPYTPVQRNANAIQNVASGRVVEYAKSMSSAMVAAINGLRNKFGMTTAFCGGGIVASQSMANAKARPMAVDVGIRPNFIASMTRAYPEMIGERMDLARTTTTTSFKFQPSDAFAAAAAAAPSGSARRFLDSSKLLAKEPASTICEQGMAARPRL
mmetsp:Transcript_60202/g.143494  ORF Transcript_60202/g.143494 Transcript_60202/m.143494 type:complete len:174 (-) Transcript_60202:649-1170(-)